MDTECHRFNSYIVLQQHASYAALPIEKRHFVAAVQLLFIGVTLITLVKPRKMPPFIVSFFVLKKCILNTTLLSFAKNTIFPFWAILILTQMCVHRWARVPHCMKFIANVTCECIIYGQHIWYKESTHLWMCVCWRLYNWFGAAINDAVSFSLLSLFLFVFRFIFLFVFLFVLRLFFSLYECITLQCAINTTKHSIGTDAVFYLQ